jgi:ankyrin repeat protein
MAPAKRGEATALHLAAANGDIEIAKALIKAGFDVNLASRDLPTKWIGLWWITPLGYAAQFGHQDMVDFLLSSGTYAKKDRSGLPLHAAVDRGNLKMARTLLAAGADVNARAGYFPGDSLTPLYVAADKGNIEMAKLLLDSGADPNKPSDNNGFSAGSGMWNNEDLTPLHAAARRKDISMAKLLLDRGADINAKNAAGSTALAMAAYGDKQAPMAKFLRERGAKE